MSQGQRLIPLYELDFYLKTHQRKQNILMPESGALPGDAARRRGRRGFVPAAPEGHPRRVTAGSGKADAPTKADVWTQREDGGKTPGSRIPASRLGEQALQRLSPSPIGSVLLRSSRVLS